MSRIPAVGLMVHYILAEGRNRGEHRPAIIVRIFDEIPTNESALDLQVFTDGSNDRNRHNQRMANLEWVTSVRPDQNGKRWGSWHWPERAHRLRALVTLKMQA